MLHELERKLTQIQNNVMKKEMELEKQLARTTELEVTVKEAKQNNSKAECGALRAEVEKLKDSLEEAKQQQKLAGKATNRHCPHRASVPWAPTVPYSLPKWPSQLVLQHPIPGLSHSLILLLSGDHHPLQHLHASPPSLPL